MEAVDTALVLEATRSQQTAQPDGHFGPTTAPDHAVLTPKQSHGSHAATSKKGLTLVLKEIELQKLHNLNIQTQSFQAQLWTEFVIPGGAKDPDLSAKGEVFPFDPQTNKPTFKPSAGWYMAQIDSRNALSYKICDAKIMTRGDDLVMAVRVEGSFTEVFELAYYPFDVQGLTITLNFNARYHGPMPIDIQVAQNCHVAMTCVSLCPPAREWEVANELHVRSHLVGTGDRQFPGISFTARATRQPFYHLVFLASPMGFFSLLSVLNAVCLRRREALNHRSQMALTLVLTMSAYRVAASAKLPPVSYFTVMDYYSIANALLVLSVAIESRALSFHIPGRPYHHEQDVETGTVDLAFTVLFVVVWVVEHVRFAWLAFQLIREPHVHDPNLTDPKNRILDEAAVPPLRVDHITHTPRAHRPLLADFSAATSSFAHNIRTTITGEHHGWAPINGERIGSNHSSV